MSGILFIKTGAYMYESTGHYKEEVVIDVSMRKVLMTLQQVDLTEVLARQNGDEIISRQKINQQFNILKRPIKWVFKRRETLLLKKKDGLNLDLITNTEAEKDIIVATTTLNNYDDRDKLIGYNQVIIFKYLTDTTTMVSVESEIKYQQWCPDHYHDYMDAEVQRNAVEQVQSTLNGIKTVFFLN